eukprot:GFYU01011381.1.p1 GENE.GFYU01011381.1~~GFYU01011381.1.p1  ORF type:complete len:155 (-),score=44.70 GFYU01011381.1:80-544(-)
MVLTQTEIDEFQEIFDLVDIDKGGSIEADELQVLMDMMGLPTTQEELERMIEEIDQDGNGEIDFDEFLAVMQNKVGNGYKRNDLIRAFETFRFENGPADTVSRAELMDAMTVFAANKISKERAEELLDQVPFNDDNRLAFRRFVAENVEDEDED